MRISDWSSDVCSSDLDLGPQTRAEIGAATLLGGYYLGLSGPVEEPFLHELPVAERRIPLERTNTPVSLFGALGDTTSHIQAIDIASLNAVLRDLSGSTARNADFVPPLPVPLTHDRAPLSARHQRRRRWHEGGGGRMRDNK